MDIIMNKNHPKWEEFLERLDGIEGCNFRYIDENLTEKQGLNDRININWNCKHGNNKYYAKEIIRKYYPECHIRLTMQFFESKGACCDCRNIIYFWRLIIKIKYNVYVIKENTLKRNVITRKVVNK
jgi:hypothetical protein